MDVSAEKTIVIRVTEQQAGILLCLAGMVSGDFNTKGRAFMNQLHSCLKEQGVVSVEAFDSSEQIEAI